jgi:GTP cyclohydrolase II
MRNLSRHEVDADQWLDPMNTMPRLTGPDRDVAQGTPGEPDLRHVHRSVAELRRGASVVLVDHGLLIVLAAETAGSAALDDMLHRSNAAPVLLLARRRAATLLGRALDDEKPLTASTIQPGSLTAGLLRGLADPTLPQSTPETLRSALVDAVLPAGAAAAVQLAKIARLLPAVLVAPVAEAAAIGLLRVEAGSIEAYPDALSAGLRRVAEADVPLDSAPDARVIAFRPLDGGVEHLAIIVGHPELEAAPLVRVHSACLTGDLLGSLRCDCGPQLRAALQRMSAEGAGVLLYLAQEGRGIGLVNKLRAYAIQDSGQDTVDANLSLGWAVDERSFLPAAIMLEQLGLHRVRLLTNNPAKIAALSACGIEVVAREPHITPPNGINDAYLLAKANRLGHLLG